MAKIPRLLPLIAIAIGGVVAVRAVGAGPGLFEGAKAWAEDAAGAVAPAPGNTEAPKAPPAVCALTPEQLAQQAGISPAELRIIQSLSTRRKELDARDADFSTTLPLMVAAEQKLDAKVQALNAIKTEIQGMLGQVDAKSKAETDRLVAVYSAMRPVRPPPCSTPCPTTSGCRSPPPCARAVWPPSWPRCRRPRPRN
jgi:flagellar motility protein MotE (MotC chaperone)